MSDSSDQSEWNEQSYFARLFFEATSNCREFQTEGNIIGWRNALDAKFSCVMAIFDKKEQQTLTQWRQEMNKAFLIYKRDKTAELDFINFLFKVEAGLDSLVNTKMPLLNLKDTMDLDQL